MFGVERGPASVRLAFTGHTLLTGRLAVLDVRSVIVVAL